MIAQLLDTNMDNWPPTTVHVQLSVPFRGYDHIAVSCLNMPGAVRCEILPANDDGAYVDMMALWVGKFMDPAEVLAAIGYEVA